MNHKHNLNDSYELLVKLIHKKYHIPKAALTKLLMVHRVPILNKLRNLKVTETIRRNEHGLYEHGETNLVFDKDTRKAYGVHIGQGQIEPLTAETIEQCLKYKFEYVVPENLEFKLTHNLNVENDFEKEIQALLDHSDDDDDDD